MPNVLALFARKREGYEHMGACEIYRVSIPLHFLETQDKRWVVSWTHLVEDIVEMHLAQAISWADLIVLPRWWFEKEHESEAIQFISDLSRTFDKRMIYECDDDYTNQYREVHRGGDTSIKAAQACDAITVSTPYLGKLMQKATGKETHTLPNCIDPRHWDAFAEGKRMYDGLVIGLAGTKTHYHDWKVLQNVMPGILADYPDTRLLLGHLHPDYFDALPEDRVIRHPGEPYQYYPGLIRQMDIVLAPVDPEDRFNWSKSAIKAIEGMASKRRVNGKWGGAAVVATDTTIYRRAINNGSNGLLTEHTEEGWDQALRQVIEDEILRRKLQVNGYRWSRNRHIQNNWKLWRNAYNSVLQGEIA